LAYATKKNFEFSTSIATFVRAVSDKQYELKDHLGNVRATVSDIKEPVYSTGSPVVLLGFTADLRSVMNYYSFGMEMPGRCKNAEYRWGFQGQEGDPEIKGQGNSVNYKYHMHDPRIGRFFAVEPLAKNYPYWTPYQFSGLMPIRFVELEGLEPGEPYESLGDAAKNFAGFYGKMSIQENREFSSTYYAFEGPDGVLKWSYAIPKRGTSSGSTNVAVSKAEGIPVAGGHTHGAWKSEGVFDGQDWNNVFSDADMENAVKLDLPEILSAPAGFILIYNPRTGSVGVLDRDAPSDPNSTCLVNDNYAISPDLSFRGKIKERRSNLKANRAVRKQHADNYKKLIDARNDDNSEIND
jgi:hypothetical protein